MFGEGGADGFEAVPWGADLEEAGGVMQVGRKQDFLVFCAAGGHDATQGAGGLCPCEGIASPEAETAGDEFAREALAGVDIAGACDVPVGRHAGGGGRGFEGDYGDQFMGCLGGGDQERDGFGTEFCSLIFDGKRDCGSAGGDPYEVRSIAAEFCPDAALCGGVDSEQNRGESGRYSEGGEGEGEPLFAVFQGAEDEAEEHFRCTTFLAPWRSRLCKH